MAHSQVKSLAINAEMKYSGLTNLLKDELHLIKEIAVKPIGGGGMMTRKSLSKIRSQQQLSQATVMAT